MPMEQQPTASRGVPPSICPLPCNPGNSCYVAGLYGRYPVLRQFRRPWMLKNRFPPILVMDVCKKKLNRQSRFFIVFNNSTEDATRKAYQDAVDFRIPKAHSSPANLPPPSPARQWKLIHSGFGGAAANQLIIPLVIFMIQQFIQRNSNVQICATGSTISRGEMDLYYHYQHVNRSLLNTVSMSMNQLIATTKFFCKFFCKINLDT